MSKAAFFTAVRFQVRILFFLLAGAGALGVVALQAGWLKPGGGPAVQPQPEEDMGEGAGVMSFTGPATVWSQIVPVDPSLTYDISAEVRTFAPEGAPPSTTRVYLGVDTLDENLTSLQSGPGTYRYAAASNYPLSSAQGWVTLEGAITGEGDESHNQFRPGTRFVRVVALLNYLDEGKRSEIRNMRLVPRLAIARR